MSRLNHKYLEYTGAKTWKQAFEAAARSMGSPASSFKNLRDEFDPFHSSNPRRGWHARPLRQNRQRVLDELHEVSDVALCELAYRILTGDHDATLEAIDALAVVTGRPYNVAERLLTGRRAEEYFLSNCESIIRLPFDSLIDMRQSAQGYDFGIKGEPARAIEVKGIKDQRGHIRFTDREWSEALKRKDDYLLVVVGNLQMTPRARVFPDPPRLLKIKCSYQKAVIASWDSNVEV